MITSRTEGGWVSAFFVMLRDGKQGKYFMKDGNVTVKKNHQGRKIIKIINLFLYCCEVIWISLT